MFIDEVTVKSVASDGCACFCQPNELFDDEFLLMGSGSGATTQTIDIGIAKDSISLDCLIREACTAGAAIIFRIGELRPGSWWVSNYGDTPWTADAIADIRQRLAMYGYSFVHSDFRASTCRCESTAIRLLAHQA